MPFKKKSFYWENLYIAGAFLVLYCLALILDSAGQNMLAGGLLIVTAFSLYIAVVYFKRNPVDITALLTLGWIFGLGLAIMRLSTYHDPWTWQSKLCFGGFYVCFLLGGMFRREKVKERKTSISLPKMYYAILIASIVSLLTFIAEAVILGYIPIFSKETHAYNYFHVSGVHYFTVSSIFTHCFTTTYILEKRRRGEGYSAKEKWSIIAANAVSFTVNVFCLGKLNILLSVAFPAFIVLGQIRIKDFKKLPWKKIIAAFFALAVAGVGVIVVFTKLRHYEPGYLDDIFSFRDSSTPTWIQYPYMYIANNYANFNYLTMCIENHTWGLRELFPVFAFTGLKFVFPSLVAFPQYFMKIELNTLTIIYDAYYDFGIIGTLVFGAVFGAVSGRVTELTKIGSPVGMLIFSQIAIYAALSFFSAWFTVPTTWFWIAITVIYGLFIREAHNGKSKK